MTDQITDQDRRMALAFAREIGNLVSPHTGAAAAGRVILATVDVPTSTLAEELMDWSHKVFLDEGGKQTMRDYSARAEQIEQERDEARAEVERLTTERVTDPSPTLNDGSMTPEHANIQPWDPWLAMVDGDYPAAAFKANGAGWICYRPRLGVSSAVGPERVRLIRRLVPAPRVITNPDELDQVKRGTVIRDGGGDMYQKILHGWYRSGSEQVHRSDDNVIILPVTALWEPGA